MEHIPVSILWKALMWLPSFLLRRFFTPQKLCDLLLIDVQARHIGVRLNVGEYPTYELYLKIINISPFTYEIDRILLDFHCAGALIKINHLNRIEINSGEQISVRISDVIQSVQANQIKKSLENHQSSLSGSIEMSTKLGKVTKHLSNLSGIRPEFINA